MAFGVGASLIRSRKDVVEEYLQGSPTSYLLNKVKRVVKVISTERIVQAQLFDVIDWFIRALENGGDFTKIVKHAEVKITRIILPGARGTGKTSALAAMLAIGVYVTGESAVCFMRHSSHLRKGIFRSVLGAINQLGLDDSYTYTVTPMQICLVGSKAVIDFTGVDDKQKLKGMKSPTGFYKFVMGDEIDTLRDNSHLSSILQTLLRGNAEIKGYFYEDEEGNEVELGDIDEVLRNTDSIFFGAYNPNEFYNHWSYSSLWEDDQANGLWVQKSDFRGMPREWLGDAYYNEMNLLLRMAQRGNKNAWNQYLNQYMGQRVIGELRLFDVVEVDKFVRGVNFPTVEEENIFRGMDFGFGDAMSTVSLNFDPENRVIKIFYEVYENDKDIRKRRTAGEIAQESVRVENINQSLVFCDTDENYLKDIRNVGLMNFVPAKKPAGSLHAGFTFLSLCRIEVASNCPNCLREFKNAQRKRDPITGAPILDVKGMEDHAIACVRYALYEFITGYRSVYRAEENKQAFGYSDKELGISEL